MHLDNSPATAEPSTGPLGVNAAASLFADLIDPPTQEPETPEPEPAIEAKETPEPADPEPAEDGPTVTVKIDGKDVEVKLSELKNGYQRQADYTKKTMETAETRKAAEAERASALQERQAYAANLQRMQAQLEGALNEQSKIDWNALLEADPVEYLKQQHLLTQRQAAHQQNLAQQQQLQAVSQAEQAEMAQKHLAAQQQALLAKLPDWKDAEKAKAEKAALREYLIKEGYEEDAIGSVSDARAVVMARKAMLYDQMISKANAAAKKVANLPQRVERSGTGENQQLDKRGAAFQRLSKTGNVRDAAAIFSSLL